MSRRHITCQWIGQAALLIRNKCRGLAAKRPYVRLHPLAYVTCTMSRGSIGAPPKRGEKRIQYGLDTCRLWTTAWP
jgi:hypothetical protein